MVEIELKFLINKNEISEVLGRLRQMDYIIGPRNYEKTTMYDNPDQLMQSTDGRIRLRIAGENSELSYKKPLTRQGIKKEIEYEVVVSDHDTTQKILKEMQYMPVSSYERYRTTITNKKNGIKVTIDEFPFADFIEIEGKEKLIRSLAEALHLNIGDNITKSCDTLFQEWRKDNNLAFKAHMLFEDYNK